MKHDLVLRTSNPNKLAEFQRYGLSIRAEQGPDLPEVAGTPTQVVMYKALAAGPWVLVEDTSLDVEGFDAGVNIRWVLDEITAKLAANPGIAGPKALWRVMLAYHDGDRMHVAQAELHGTLIGSPRGGGHSFDPYFVPGKLISTLGELEDAGVKDLISPRCTAVKRLLAGNCSSFAVSSIPEWTGAYQAA